MCNSEKVCGKCEKICTTYLKSEGFETFEFWGQKTKEEQFTELSECCNSEEVYTLAEAFENIGDEHLQQELFERINNPNY